MSARSLWHAPQFLKLWAGQSVSEVGSAVTRLALPLVAILVLHASPFQVGLLTAAQFAPFLLVGLPAGAVVDRLRRRPVLIVGDLGRSVLLATVPVAHGFGVLSIAQLYGVALATGVLTVFFDVAYQSYLPLLVDRDQLTDGNAKLTVSQSAADVAGPGIAGVVIDAVGAASALVVDAASFVVSGLALLTIRRAEPPPRPADGARPTWRHDIGEGLRFVLAHPMLRPIAGCTATSNFGSSVVFAVLTLYMVRQLHYSPGRIGLVFALGSFGFLLGALLARRLTARVGLGPAVLGGAVVSASGPLLLPMAAGSAALPLLIAGELLFSLGVPVYNVGQVSLRQAITPHRLQGRMNASMRFVVWGTLPLGSLVGGAVGGAAGLRPAVVLGAAVGAASPLWLLFSPVRRLTELPAHGEDLTPDTVSGAVSPAAGPVAGG